MSTENSGRPHSRTASVKFFGHVVSPKTNLLYGIYVPGAD